MSKKPENYLAFWVELRNCSPSTMQNRITVLHGASSTDSPGYCIVCGALDHENCEIDQ